MSQTILLADDMELFLEIERSFFRREAVRVETARTGKAALEAIRKMKPDLVFLDLYMPEGNGDEVCQEIKRDPSLKHIPVIMVTSSEKEFDVRRCREAGCDGVIHKPLKKEQFLAAAAQHLDLPIWSGRRIDARIEMSFTTTAGGKGTGYMRNLSTGGLFIECPKPPATDSLLELVLTLDNGGPALACRGRVAWRNTPLLVRNPDLPTGVGIQFVDLPPQALETIQDWIARQV